MYMCVCATPPGSSTSLWRWFAENLEKEGASRPTLDWPIVTRPLEHGGDATDVTLMLPTLEDPSGRSTTSVLENDMQN